MNRTFEPGALQDVLVSPDDGSFEAAVEAFQLQEATAERVAASVATAEKADPGVPRRAMQEALARHRKHPR